MTSFRTTHPLFVVTAASRSKKLLYSHLRDEIGALVSISDQPGGTHYARPSRGIIDSFGSNALVLEFEDSVNINETNAPKKEDIERLLRWGARVIPTLKARGKKVNIHCYAGQCRSTAAALLLIAQDKLLTQGVVLRSKTEMANEAMAELLTACETTPSPNSLMVALGDEALGFERKLINAATAQNLAPAPAVGEALPRVGSALVGAIQAGIILLDDCECDEGWVHFQHPLKPPGVSMSASPCPKCNADGKKPYPVRTTSGSQSS